jgi:hypothetical protein
MKKGYENFPAGFWSRRDSRWWVPVLDGCGQSDGAAGVQHYLVISDIVLPEMTNMELQRPRNGAPA